MKDRENILVVINPIAGSAKSKVLINSYLNFIKLHSSPYTTFYTTGNLDTLEINKILLSQHFHQISILGGDGTLNLVINSLPHFDYILRLVPSGSGNDFYRYLVNNKRGFIPWNLFQQTILVDIWRCNDHLFINSFGIGFDSKVVKDLTENNWGIIPSFKYAIYILKNIFFFKPIEIFVENSLRKVFMIVAANGSYFGNNMCIAPSAISNDQQLEIVVFKKFNWWRRIFVLLSVLRGKHLNKSYVQYYRTDKLCLRSENEIEAQVEGEILAGSSFQISHAGQISFLIPTK